MKLWNIIAVFLLALCACYAVDTDATGGPEGFIRQVIQSLLDDENKITFSVADRLFAIDNGETLSKEDLRKAWPEFAEAAFKEKVSLDQFFKDVEVQVGSPRDNKRLMSNKRVLDVYTYQDGDLYCDASHVKEGVADFIAYDKAFIYIIRRIEGRWTLIGIGG
jgi:hypothetical protein